MRRFAKLCLLVCGSLLFVTSRAQKKGLYFGFGEAQPSRLIGAPWVSAVMGDAGDPAAVYGVSLTVSWDGTKLRADEYSVSATSSNDAVLRDSGIHIQKKDGEVLVLLFPSGVGYTDITFTLTAKKNTASLLLHYAVSASSETPAQTRWHTGGSDASACVAVGNDYMLVGDDELDNLFLYNRHQSGLPLASFYYGDKLDLTDGAAPYLKEVDVEAGTRSLRLPDRTYWLGSMSNSADYKTKPNRNRLFAVTVTDTAGEARCKMTGYYDALRDRLISWGNDHDYKFGKSAASGVNPKDAGGFNIEAMVFAPDSNTLYIGFRAPQVPTTNRTKALIAPIENFEAWFSNGRPKQKPVIGEPVELDLGGRGFRDMIRLSNGVYIILAGAAGDARHGAVYRWSGIAGDSAMLIPDLDISQLNAEGVLEMDDENGKLMPDRLQVISDNGTAVYYNDNRPAKEFGQTALRKFRSDVIISTKPVLNQ